MGRPVEVSDADVIAAGERLIADDKTVTKTALWEACGQRGRPDRLFGVWRTHVEAVQKTDNLNTLPDALPDHVRLLLAQSGAAISRGLERSRRAFTTNWRRLSRRATSKNGRLWPQHGPCATQARRRPTAHWPGLETNSGSAVRALPNLRHDTTTRSVVWLLPRRAEAWRPNNTRVPTTSWAWQDGIWTASAKLLVRPRAAYRSRRSAPPFSRGK